MYGVGSTGKVQDGQHVFVSIRRDSEKTILTADGSIVNSMVKFPQAQEQVQVTLYAFDNTTKKKNNNNVNRENTTHLITGYQAKYFKIYAFRRKW